MSGVYTDQPSIRRSIVRSGILLVVLGPLFLFVWTLVKLVIIAAVWAVETVIVVVAYSAAFAAYIVAARNERRNKPAA